MSAMLIQMMAAFGGQSRVRTVIQLQGSAGSPIRRWHLEVQPDEAIVVWLFGTTDSIPNSIVRADVQYAAYAEGDLATYTRRSSWNNVKAYTDPYWIRATLNDGDPPNWIASNNLGQWYPMTSGNPAWGWAHDGPIPLVGSVKVEIADSDTPDQDSNIIATGYYGATVSSEM